MISKYRNNFSNSLLFIELILYYFKYYIININLIILINLVLILNKLVFFKKVFGYTFSILFEPLIRKLISNTN